MGRFSKKSPITTLFLCFTIGFTNAQKYFEDPPPGGISQYWNYERPPSPFGYYQEFDQVGDQIESEPIGQNSWNTETRHHHQVVQNNFHDNDENDGEHPASPLPFTRQVRQQNGEGWDGWRSPPLLTPPKQGKRPHKSDKAPRKIYNYRDYDRVTYRPPKNDGYSYPEGLLTWPAINYRPLNTKKGTYGPSQTYMRFKGSNQDKQNLTAMITEENPDNPTPVMPNSEPMMPNSEPMMPNSEAMMPNSEPMMPNSKAMMPNSEPMMPNSVPMMPNSMQILMANQQSMQQEEEPTVNQNGGMTIIGNMAQMAREMGQNPPANLNAEPLTKINIGQAIEDFNSICAHTLYFFRNKEIGFLCTRKFQEQTEMP